MKNEFTVILEFGDDGWWAATCPEVPGTIGQGRTPEAAQEDLGSAIALMLQVLREEALESASPSALRRTATFG